jgi:excisionase family DNA binding protein
MLAAMRREQLMDALDDLFADQPKQLSVDQAAELLGIQPRTVQKWVRDGTVPAYRLTGTWLILRDELKEWVRTGSNRGGTRAAEGPDDGPSEGPGDASG